MWSEERRGQERGFHGDTRFARGVGSVQNCAWDATQGKQERENVVWEEGGADGLSEARGSRAHVRSKHVPPKHTQKDRSPRFARARGHHPTRDNHLLVMILVDFDLSANQ